MGRKFHFMWWHLHPVTQSCPTYMIYSLSLPLSSNSSLLLARVDVTSSICILVRVHGGCEEDPEWARRQNMWGEPTGNISPFSLSLHPLWEHTSCQNSSNFLSSHRESQLEHSSCALVSLPCCTAWLPPFLCYPVFRDSESICTLSLSLHNLACFMWYMGTWTHLFCISM